MQSGDFNPSDLVQIVTTKEAYVATRSYEDWLSWDPNNAEKFAIVLSAPELFSSSMIVMCDGKEIWMSKYFLKKVQISET